MWMRQTERVNVVALSVDLDLERIRALHHEVFGVDDRFLVDATGSTDGAGEDDLAYGVESADGRMIAYLYGEVVPAHELVHIWELAVHPAHQRRGHGRSLLRWLGDLCHSLDVRLITATPRASAPESSAYLRRCGFRTTDPLAAMEATPADVLSAIRPDHPGLR